VQPDHQRLHLRRPLGILDYWARAKWQYTVPIMENLKIFEMPLPGYLGFPALALECFTMYVFVQSLIGRPGRPIAL
jgi:hypothetical protein